MRVDEFEYPGSTKTGDCLYLREKDEEDVDGGAVKKTRWTRLEMRYSSG